ncbi:MAG: hypothetical protein ABEJ78_01875 [Haloferacaceae archaeon]
MSSATVTRWSRRYVAVGACSLVVWQLATLLGSGRETGVVVGVYGFVLHVVFGKAYALVPSYFERDLALARAPAVQFPFAVVGTACLAAATVSGVPAVVHTAGATLWAVGVAVFCGALAWTVRDNLTGSATGTGEANAHRRRIDRVANAFVPVAFAYLLLGTYETLATGSPVPSFVGGGPPVTAHLLAAGGAVTLLLAVGFRLLPRFLVATPPAPLVGVVLPAAAVGPLLLATSFGGGPAFRIGAAVEAVAVVGFAVAFATTFARSERRRIGFYGVLAGVVAGSAGVALGLGFALGHLAPVAAAARLHFRLNVLGFLGLSIVGVSYQFYPPTVGSFRGASNRTAGASLVAIAAGLVVEAVGRLGGGDAAVPVGVGLALLGASLYAFLVLGVFRERPV